MNRRQANRQEMEDALQRVRGGTLSFDAFARQTLPRWESIAGGLLKCWDAPGWVAKEDVIQDLLLVAWRRIPMWDPTRPDAKSLEEYVRWHATDKAKKAIHRARLGRRQHRNEDRTRSRYDRPMSSFLRKEDEDGTEPRGSVAQPSVPSSQEDLVDMRRAFRRARDKARSVQELIAVQALEVTDGEVEAAASLLYEDREARYRCELVSEREAFKVAAQAATRVIGRLTMAA